MSDRRCPCCGKPFYHQSAGVIVGITSELSDTLCVAKNGAVFFHHQDGESDE